MKKTVYKLDSFEKHVFVGALPTTPSQFIGLAEMLAPFKDENNTIKPILIVGLAGELDYWYGNIARPSLLNTVDFKTVIYHGFYLLVSPHFRPFASTWMCPTGHLYDGLNHALNRVKANHGPIYVGCPYDKGIRTALFTFMSYLSTSAKDHATALERTVYNCPRFKTALSKFPDLLVHLAESHEV